MTFQTDDGVALVGEVHGGGPVGFVLAHMYRSDRSAYTSFAGFLANRGFMALNFDYRGVRDSCGLFDGEDLYRDVLAAAEVLRERGAERIWLVGASIGGPAVLTAAANGDVDGVVTLSGAANALGAGADESVVASIEEAKLFVVARNEGALMEDARGWFEASTEPRRLLVVPGYDHGTDLFEFDQAERVRSAILAFVAEQQ
ncbi:MAG: alpha/beta fold hydrolase [Actinobacteria bacterium]|nr:alpha/beta fold hydrolase [Actinomycetota bacterium]